MKKTCNFSSHPVGRGGTQEVTLIRNRGALARVVKVGVVAAVLALGLIPFSSAYAADTITVVGANTPMDGIMRPVQPAFEKATGTKLRLVDGVFPEIYQDLVSGNFDAYVTTSPFENAIRQLKSQGTTLSDDQKKELRVTELAKVPLAVFVNKENPLAKISADQLRMILSGKVENWQSLTGMNLTIRPLVLSGYPVALSYQFLDGDELGPRVLQRETAREIKQEAVAYKNILAILPASSFLHGLKKIEGPAMAKAAILVTKGEPSSKVKALIEFIKGAGRKLVEVK